MRLKLYLLFALCTVVLSSCCQRVIVVDYDASVKDYTPVVKEILEANAKGNFTLRFSRGEFNFYPEQAARRYLAISNNDNGDKSIVFTVAGMKSVNIVGDSSQFMFHGGLVPFSIIDSEGVNISGISIDYDFPFVFEGRVVSNDLKTKSFVVSVHKDNIYEIRDSMLYFKGYDWESGLGENIVFNPETRSPYYATELYEHPYHNGLMKARKVGEDLVELYGCLARQMPPVNSVYTDKGAHGTNRRYPAFSVQNSSAVTLSDVRVYHSGAMALIAENVENVSLERFDVAVREGTSRMISASADATHFINCRGVVSMNNCRFESMLDDATNIHGTYMKVDSLIDSRTFKCSFGHYQQEGSAFAAVGDTLTFVDRANMMNIGRGRVESVVVNAENNYHITTSFDLTGVQAKSMAVDNVSRATSVIIRNCIVRYNRARSFLLSTPGDVLVEGCAFSSMMAGIRICGDANYWFEAGPTQSITIRDNRFTDLGIGSFSPQAILQIDPVIPKERRGDGYYHRKIVFEGNLIETFDSQVIYALSVDSLIIRNNTFVDTKSYKQRYPGLSVIDVQHCGNVCIENNDFSLWQSGATLSMVKCANVDARKTELTITENPNKFFYQN